MNNPREHPAETAAIGTANDRRRPGRKEFANPFLIALLRRRTSADANAARHQPAVAVSNPADGETDALGAARGISVGLAASAVGWACVGMAAWIWLQRSR